MLELLISILISLNIHYTVIDGSKIQISSEDMKTLESSDEFIKSNIQSMEGITVNDGIDPTSDAVNKE